MVVAASRLFAFGVRIQHLEQIGDAIGQSFKAALACPCNECGLHEWTDDQSEAWSWCWEVLSADIAKTIRAQELRHVQLVRDSWEAVKASKSSVDLGDLFYTDLQEEAPQVIHLFQRPRKMQAYLFIQAMELIVRFGEDPASFFDELKPLVIRHIKYGVRSQYMKPFGIVLMRTMEHVLGPLWTTDVSAAWKSLWTRCSCVVSRSLNVGTNLITVSIVNGDLCQLRRAVACAPRCDRAKWIVQVQVNGSVLSPLYWAVRDCKYAMARFMLRDLLTIRADREEYYYGAHLLFESHPDLVSALCRESPQLVSTLFDGLMWHSQAVEKGKVRVNYYIGELYGAPEGDPWASPLAVFCAEGKPWMFDHPVLDKVLQLKWGRLKLLFFAEQTVFALILVLFMVGFVDGASELTCSQHTVNLRRAVASMSGIVLLVMLVLMHVQIRSGQCVRIQPLPKLPSISFVTPRLLANKWNTSRFIACVLIIIAALSGHCNQGTSRSDQGSTWNMHVEAWAGLLLWIQFSQILVTSTRLSALIYTVGILLSDVVRLLLVILILLVAFAAYLTCLSNEGFGEFGQSILSLVRVSIEVSKPDLIEVGGWSLFMLLFFVTFIQVGMLSILVAQLSLSYETTSQDKTGYAKMNKAFVVVEIESVLSQAMRTRIYDVFAFDQPLEFDSGDLGPTGGVQVRENAAVRSHPTYVPDRILRFPGDADPKEPWPEQESDSEDEWMEDDADDRSRLGDDFD
uniref:Globin domain-containing protein n=2 Tax=Hemiselmis andersenii TaxID=464988 RepID=A0A7S0U4W9_HEMAN